MTYSRDSEGRIDGVTGQVPGGSVETLASSISYKPFGPMAAWTNGNGVTNDRTFDQDYRVTDIEITAASLIHDTSYSYSVVDQITALNDAINSSLNQAFDYDLLDRLDEADGDYGDQSYSYDANGNRTQRYNATTLTTQTLTYGTGTNQLATVDSAAVVHDGAGNRTSDSGGTRVYSYNHADRMIQFTDSSVVQADYVMNAEGQRVTKERHVGASTYVRHYFYDQSGRLLGEYLDNPDGSYGYIDYVWLEDTPLLQEERSFNSSDVLTGTQETWLHVDHLNTPRIGTNDAQTLVWRWDSDPFGVGTPGEDPDSDSTDHVVNLRFPGQYVDEELGLNYNYFRTYDPTIGRYTQSDPIGLNGGLNTYTYAYDDPVNLTDPYGLRPATHGDCGGAPGCRMNNQSGARRVFVDFGSLADEAKAYVCRYGRVTLSASGGVGLGATGRLVVTAQGISGYVGVGAGIGLGASATAGGGLSNARGAGVATTVTANAGAGPGASANLTAGTNGVTGAAGVGVGLGAGAVAAIGFGGPIVELENVDCSCLE